MQAVLEVKCGACKKTLGKVRADTADMGGMLQVKVNEVVLLHRSSCRYYRGKAVK